jgi:peroxiredoxin
VHTRPRLSHARQGRLVDQAKTMSDRDQHEARRHDRLRIRDLAERVRREASRVGKTPVPHVTVKTIYGADVEDLASLVGKTAIIYLFPGTPTSPIDRERTLELDIAQRRAFSERAGDYMGRGYRVFGISSQLPHILHEMADRHHDLNHDLLSDEPLRLADALRLPTFPVGTSLRAYHRLAIIVESHEIRASFPAHHPRQVDAWLRIHE